MEDKRYEVLELLAKLSNYRGLTYEIEEIKDGRIISIKNIKIDKIDLNCPLK
jgi:hypothetical protein